MTAKLLTGKERAQEILESLKPRIAAAHPGLGIIQVGSDPASTTYIAEKVRACEQVGIQTFQSQLPEDTPIADILQKVRDMNAVKRVSGLIVQFPLPGPLRQYEPEFIKLLDPSKDVDCFTEENVKKISEKKSLDEFRSTLSPGTPLGVLELLDYHQIPIAGKVIAVIGQGRTAGKPLSKMLKQLGGQVHVCDSKTPRQELEDLCSNRADIIISAVGTPGIIPAAIIRQGAEVINIGSKRGTDGSYLPDIEIENAMEVASAITPMIGGVGPLTVACLLRNTVLAAELNNK